MPGAGGDGRGQHRQDAAGQFRMQRRRVAADRFETDARLAQQPGAFKAGTDRARAKLHARRALAAIVDDHGVKGLSWHGYQWRLRPVGKRPNGAVRIERKHERPIRQQLAPRGRFTDEHQHPVAAGKMYAAVGVAGDHELAAPTPLSAQQRRGNHVAQPRAAQQNRLAARLDDSADGRRRIPFRQRVGILRQIVQGFAKLGIVEQHSLLAGRGRPTQVVVERMAGSAQRIWLQRRQSAQQPRVRTSGLREQMPGLRRVSTGGATIGARTIA